MQLIGIDLDVIKAIPCQSKQHYDEIEAFYMKRKATQQELPAVKDLLYYDEEFQFIQIRYNRKSQINLKQLIQTNNAAFVKKLQMQIKKQAEIYFEDLQSFNLDFSEVKSKHIWITFTPKMDVQTIHYTCLKYQTQKIVTLRMLLVEIDQQFEIPPILYPIERKTVEIMIDGVNKFFESIKFPFFFTQSQILVNQLIKKILSGKLNGKYEIESLKFASIHCNQFKTLQVRFLQSIMRAEKTLKKGIQFQKYYQFRDQLIEKEEKLDHIVVKLLLQGGFLNKLCSPTHEDLVLQYLNTYWQKLVHQDAAEDKLKNKVLNQIIDEISTKLYKNKDEIKAIVQKYVPNYLDEEQVMDQESIQKLVNDVLHDFKNAPIQQQDQNVTPQDNEQ